MWYESIHSADVVELPVSLYFCEARGRFSQVSGDIPPLTTDKRSYYGMNGEVKTHSIIVGMCRQRVTARFNRSVALIAALDVHVSTTKPPVGYSSLGPVMS